MEFINETKWPAELFRDEIEEDKMINSFLARIRYRIRNCSELVPINDEQNNLSDIRRERIECEYGVIEEDLFYPRTGTDIIILGDAISSKGSVNGIPILVKAGPYNLAISVIGHRIWEKSMKLKKLIPSEPIPFESMPITYNRSFGGSVLNEHGNIVYAQNPVGVGLYLTQKDALGNPLPNIENIDQPIQHWDDHPEPVGLMTYPSEWGLRLDKALYRDQNGKNMQIQFNKGFFDRAHPYLSGKQLKSGDFFSIIGMNKTNISFQLPRIPIELLVQIGYNVRLLKPKIEEVFIDLKNEIVEIAFRKLFHYDFVHHSIRKTILRQKLF